MLVTCFLLGVDSSNPDIDDSVRNGENIIDDDLPQEILDSRNYRYSVICTVSVCVCVCAHVFLPDIHVHVCSV